MQCPNGCHSPMAKQEQTKIFKRNDEYIVVVNLEMFVCQECLQESTPLSTARIIEDILNGKKKPVGNFTADLYKAA